MRACLVYMVKIRDPADPQEEWKVDGHMMMVLCGMGVPMGTVVFHYRHWQRNLTDCSQHLRPSAAAVAAMTAGGKIGNFLACPFDAMGSTMATYGGQNVGSRQTGSSWQRP